MIKNYDFGGVAYPGRFDIAPHWNGKRITFLRLATIIANEVKK